MTGDRSLYWTETLPVSAISLDLYDNKSEYSIQTQEDVKSKTGDVEIVRKELEKEADVERLVPRPHSVNDVSSIPNGGLRAWLQVLGAFFLFFNSWGIINTFGSYQAYYTTTLLSSSTPSAISCIGSIQACALLIVGALSGPIYDAGYFHALIAAGAFLLILGHIMLSLCQAYWQVLLAQAFCIGMGCGALFVPGVAILSTYFSTRLALATGIATSGASFGGVLYPILLQKLLPRLGFPWTIRILALLLVLTLLPPYLVMRVRVLPPKKRSLLDLPAFRSPAYSLSVVGMAIGFTALYLPFFYAQVYALHTRLTSPDVAFYLLSIMNGASVLGRIIPNYIADRIGVYNVLLPCTLCASLLCFSFLAAHNTGGILVLVALYGFFSGTFVSLQPAVIVHLSADKREKIGTRLGQSFAVIAAGVLAGAPVGGGILQGSGFEGVWIFGGSVLVVSAGVLGGSRVCWRGWGWVKA